MSIDFFWFLKIPLIVNTPSFDRRSKVAVLIHLLRHWHLLVVSGMICVVSI